MIRGYEPHRPLAPEGDGHFQWPAALKAGLAAGVVFLLVSRGNPWAGLTFSTPVIMGRVAPATLGIPLALIWLIHMGIAVAYGFIISVVVARLVQWRAILIGGLVGAILYGLNWAIVHFAVPEMEGSEASVLFTHIVFGLVAAGAYRGFLTRKQYA